MQAARALSNRDLAVVELDAPLLFTSDEPVVLLGDGGHAPHTDECFLTAKQRRRLRRASAAGVDEAFELVHLYLTRPRVLTSAEFIAIPLDPRRLLLFGPANTAGPTYLRYTGDDAIEVGSQVQSALLHQSYTWIARHPGHPTIGALDLPSPGPLLALCDGGSVLAQALDETPFPLRPARLRRDWA